MEKRILGISLPNLLPGEGYSVLNQHLDTSQAIILTPEERGDNPNTEPKVPYTAAGTLDSLPGFREEYERARQAHDRGEFEPMDLSFLEPHINPEELPTLDFSVKDPPPSAFDKYKKV